jgi:hypothetical protein
MKKYIKANNELDIESMLNYYPEATFDSISKKELKKELKEFYSKKSQSKISMDLEFKIDTLISRNNIKYARIRHGQNITMDFTEFKGENGMDYAIKMAYSGFVMEYGEENVSHKKGEWIFNIRLDRPLYGIKKSSGNWKFIEFSEVTEKYIPVDIIVPKTKN